MPRAEKTNTNGTKNGAKPGVVKLSDLAIEGREFELGGKIYHTKSPIQLTLPEIARVDKMGKEINKWLPEFGKGVYPEGEDMEKFQTLLIDLVVAVSDAPYEAAVEAFWWQQLLIIGLFQSIAGMDFLEKQLPELAGIPESQREKIKAAMKPQTESVKEASSTSTSPTP